MAFFLPPSPLPLRLVATAFSLAASLVSSTGAAHGLDAGRYTIEREGLIVRIVGTPRSADLRAFDDDGDGLLGRSEVRAHRAALRIAVDESFSVTNEAGVAPVCEPTDVSTPGSGDPRVLEPRADHLRFTRVCRFDHPPAELRLHDRLVARVDPTDPRERAPTLVDAVLVSAPINGARTLLREVETVALTPRAPRATVLRDERRVIAAGPSANDRRPRSAAWSVLLVVGLAAVPSLVLRRRRRGEAPLPISPRTAAISPSSSEARSS